MFRVRAAPSCTNVVCKCGIDAEGCNMLDGVQKKTARLKEIEGCSACVHHRAGGGRTCFSCNLNSSTCLCPGGMLAITLWLATTTKAGLLSTCALKSSIAAWDLFVHSIEMCKKCSPRLGATSLRHACTSSMAFSNSVPFSPCGKQSRVNFATG